MSIQEYVPWKIQVIPFLFCNSMLFMLVGCPANTRMIIKPDKRPVQKRPKKVISEHSKQVNKRPGKTKKKSTPRLYGSAHAYTFYLRGKMLSLKGKFKQAVQMFKLAIAHDEYDPYLYFSIAKEYAKQKQFRRTIFWCRKALEQSSAYAPSYHLLGKVYLSLQKKEKSIASFEKAIEMNPLLAETYLDFDYALQQFQRPLQERKRLFKKMTRILPQRHEGFLRLAQVSELLGENLLAIAYYKKAINRYPSHAEALYAMGQLYEQKEKWTQAIKAYRLVVDYRPEAWQVRVELGALFLHRAKPHDAQLAGYQFNYVMREAESNPKYKRAYMIALWLFEKERFRTARAWFERSLRKRRSFQKARVGLAMSFYKLGRKKKAFRILRSVPKSSGGTYIDAGVHHLDFLIREGFTRKATNLLRKIRPLVKKQPQNWLRLSQAYTERCTDKRLLANETKAVLSFMSHHAENLDLAFHASYLHFRQRKYALCERVLKGILKKNPHHANALNFLGYLYSVQGVHLKKALNFVKKALKVKPGNAYFLDSLGWILYRLRRWKDAKKTLELAKNKMPNESTILLHLGLVYRKQGLGKKALLLFQKALKGDPEPDILQKLKLQIRQLSGSKRS